MSILDGWIDTSGGKPHKEQGYKDKNEIAKAIKECYA